MELLIVLLVFLLLLLVGGVVLVFYLIQMQNTKNNVLKDGKTNYSVNGKVLSAFLEEVEESYSKSFRMRNVKYLLPYCTLPLVQSLHCQMIYNKSNNINISSRRKIKWEILTISSNIILVRKKIEFLPHKGTVIPSGTTFFETWAVAYTPDIFKLVGVKESYD